MKLKFHLFLLAAVSSFHKSFVHSYTLVGNGKIYTVDESNGGGPWVDAIAIDDEGVISAIGTEDSIINELGTESEYWDLNGKMMMPGFQDSHLHAVEAGINNGICYIEPDADLYDIPFYFEDEDYCTNGGKFGGQGWIVGAGVDIAKLAKSVEENDYEYPIEVLDQSFGDTPLLIIDALGHGAIVNSRAMELVGYNTLTGNPPGGIIDRDPQGNPTGVVRENAQQPFRDLVFPPTAENQQIAFDSLLEALKILAQNGITTVSDAGGFWRQAQVESWTRAENEGQMTARASNALYVYPDVPIHQQLDDLTSRFSNDPNKLVRFNQAKIYVDGILSLGTSALKQPYSSSPLPGAEYAYGFEYFGNQATLYDVSSKLSQEGFQLHFHVTGDRGAELALNGIQVSDQDSGPHRLTHCYLVDEADRGRFNQIGAIADMQLAPSSLDPGYQEEVAAFIGWDRAEQLLPATEIYNVDGLIVLSSDWDADTLEPLKKLQAVLTREYGTSIPDLATAIQMMTLNPAILLQHDDKTGSITVGKYADLIILDKNIFDIAPYVEDAQVVATILQGKAVFDPDGITGESVGEFSAAPTTGNLSIWLIPVLVSFILGIAFAD